MDTLRSSHSCIFLKSMGILNTIETLFEAQILDSRTIINTVLQNSFLAQNGRPLQMNFSSVTLVIVMAMRMRIERIRIKFIIKFTILNASANPQIRRRVSAQVFQVFIVALDSNYI